MTPQTRATVAICAHYVPARIPYLSLVLEAILEWSMARVDVVLISNDPAILTEAAIVAAKENFSSRGWSLEVDLATHLEHPYLLPWRQSRILRDWLPTARKSDDYYVYIEDDIVLNSNNIDYYIKSLESLRPHGLIPGFLRYENRDGRRNSVDLTEPQLVSIYPTVKIGEVTFVCPVNPYWAGFIFDADLASEYLASDSSDMFESERVTRWDIRARAAMGLTWESVPGRHKSRCVVPLIDYKPAEYCEIWHCAQNYNPMPDSKFAKIPLDKIFIKGGAFTILKRAVRKLSNVLR